MIFMAQTTVTNVVLLSLHHRNLQKTSINLQNPFNFKKTTQSHNLLSRKPLSVSLTKSSNYKTIGYNTKIHEFCELGDLQNAIKLLRTAQSSEIEVTTYCSILQLCAETNSLEDGKMVHSVIRSNGVVFDSVLGSKLVFMYVTCGDVREGRLVFDKIMNEKVFLWNLMINGYAKIGDFDESISLFKKMVYYGVEVNSHTFSCVLKCLAALGRVRDGECVHGWLLKLGFGGYNNVVNSLIAFYWKIRRAESSCKVFDRLSERDVVSWNSMISGCVTNGLSREGLWFFVEMISQGVDADLATIVNVLTASANCEDVSFGKEVHGFAVKSKICRQMKCCNSLIDMYSKCSALDCAIRVFETMGKRNVVSWTSLIGGHAKEGLSDGAIRLFDEMEREGIRPDAVIIVTVLHACACSGSLEDGKKVHDYVKENDMQLNIFVSNALMDMYAKCGCMEDANSVFLEMPVKDIISWNTMIGGYSKNSLPNEALDLFVRMLQNSKPDAITIACILPACASLAALDKGREIHDYILRNGFFSDRRVANALVDMYAKSGVLLLARLLFDMIPEKDLISWTVMVAGYGMHGFGNEAIVTFHEMREAGIEPDEVSFISILYACSHSGLVNEGWRFFNYMRNEYQIEPKLEHYACMVDLLSRAGRLSMAYKFIKSMPIKPDATIWGALLCGCRTHHDVKLAEEVAEHVFELEPENTGYYVLLANIYSEAEKWEEVKKLREKIGRRRLKKNPGCSWIEIKGKVQIFTAGDNSHGQGRRIDSLLKRLRSRLKEEGYVPRLRYALIKGDDWEKEMALCGHSEKLAMAFGILNLPPGRTIRVTKNLRVCGDCHETAKFISKTTNREIVLRDLNRFHHFKDGACSCRGFW